MEIYCVKCKAKKEIKDYDVVTLKNNRSAAKSTCPDCGSKILRFLPKDPSRTDGPVTIKKDE